MTKYKVIPDFVPSELCRSLIDDYVAHTPSDSFRWHGGRKLVPKTSSVFANLCDSSDAWNTLASKISSADFSINLMDELGIPTDVFQIVNVFGWFSSRFSWLTKRASFPVRNSHPGFLFAWLIYGFTVRSIVSIYALYWRLRGKKVAEVFFDASSAANGYKREIHRDSDQRVFVFLLYLNSPSCSDAAIGGDLCLHALAGADFDPLPQPHPDKTVTIKKIKPEPGCLVIFENDLTSYHSVSEMKGFNEERFFVYGSLTILSGKNAKIKNSKYSMPTDFKMYL